MSAFKPNSTNVWSMTANPKARTVIKAVVNAEQLLHYSYSLASRHALGKAITITYLQSK